MYIFFFLHLTYRTLARKWQCFPPVGGICSSDFSCASGSSGSVEDDGEYTVSLDSFRLFSFGLGASVRRGVSIGIRFR